MQRTAWTVITGTMVMLSLQTFAAQAKRVVLMPTPTISHVRYHVKVARALQALGHHAWLTVPDYLQDEEALHNPNVSLISFRMSEDLEKTVAEQRLNMYFSGDPSSMKKAASTAVQMCDEMLRNSDLERAIREAKPDLMVLDNIPPVYPLMVFPYKLRVPFAMIGTMYDVHTTRIPFSSAANPMQIGMGVCSDDMTFFERVKSMLTHALFFVYSPFMLRDLVSIYAPEMPFIPNSELMARAELWLVEMDHILDYPRPTLPNVKLIGGTVADKAKPLPPILQDFMDSAKKGVVVVTFGGSVLGVPKTFSDKLLETFLKLPFKVVFRSNLTSPDPDKVWTSKWLPQNDLLGHPNTKLFLSHCGKNGQYEALFHAVPLLCNPMFSEQPYNSERIRKKGFGEVVDIRSITPEELHSRIMTVAQEPRYKLAISKASTLFRQQYGSPMKEAAKWLDHVMQYGGEYMRFAGQKMPLYQFLALDVLAFVFALGMIMCITMYFCIKRLCKCCLKRKPKAD